MAKKKGDNTLIYGLVFFGVLAASSGAVAVAANNRLLVAFQNVKVRKEGRLLGARFVFDINYVITNNNPVDISISGIGGTLFYQRNRVIDFESIEPIMLKAGETKNIKLVESTSILNVLGAGLQAIGTLIDNKVIDTNVEVEGSIVTNFAQLPEIPFSQTVPLLT